MLPVRLSGNWAFFGSLLKTLSVLVMFFPLAFWVSSVTVTVPSPPGGISRTKSAMVQPHVPLTLVILRVASPRFLILKTCS